jgi:gliding motility-associated lipoprotein GldD
MIKKSRNTAMPILLIIILLVACNDDYTPRSKDYPYLELPKEHTYVTYQPNNCPFTFEHSTYAKVVRDSQIFDQKPTNDCWINVTYPQYDATIYLSYKSLTKDYSLLQLKNEAHKLTYEHAKRANYIEPSLLQTNNDVYGLIYEVGGAAASPTQFFVTDTVQHWMRGSLYFKTSPNPDSLAPLIKYVNRDIEHLITSMRWANVH